MKKVTIFIAVLFCYTSISFGQTADQRRNAANALWTAYAKDARNPKRMPRAVPNSARNVDTRVISPSFSALETALRQLAEGNGGMIRFNNGSARRTIRFNRYIHINQHYPTRNRVKTIVIQGRNITFDGQNRSSLFVVRGNLRVIFQDATFRNANMRYSSMNHLRREFRTGGAAIEVAQAGANAGSLRVRNCQFINNTVSHFRGIGENQNGAAIRLNTGSNGEVFGCLFRNNRAVTGGAIGATSINKLTIINSTFDRNISNGYISNSGYMHVVEGAGALRVDRTRQPLEVYGSKFLRNEANVKVSVMEVFIRPIPEGSQNYPKGNALVIDNCEFRQNKHHGYRGAVNPRQVFYAGCIVFHSGGTNGRFKGGRMKLTNSIFDRNEVGQANIRIINSFNISNCTFANTKFLKNASATQQGAVFLQAVPNNSSFNNCTFYKNEPNNGARASDIMFWLSNIPSKVSLNNSIFYRNNKNTAIKQVHRPLRGGNNNQHIPGVQANKLSKVTHGASNTSNPNIRPNNISNMCLGNNSLRRGLGGLSHCGRNSRVSSQFNQETNEHLSTGSEEAFIFPNPVDNQVKIKGKHIGEEVIIINQLKQVVYRTTLNKNNASLSLGHLKPGMYLLSVGGKVVRLCKK